MSTPTGMRARLPFVGIAVALAAVSQALVAAPAFRGIGWVLFVVAGALFAALCKDFVTVRIAGGRLHEPILGHPVSRSRFFRVTLISSAGTSLAALVAFALSETSGAGWFLYAFSLALLLSGVLWVSLPGAWSRLRLAKKSRGHWGLLVAITAAALFVRVWQLDAAPAGLWHDEALVGLAAQRLLADPTYRVLYEPELNRPLHIAYATAGSFLLFGSNVAALRLVSALFGALSVPAAYLLFERLLGEQIPAGLMAAALLAVMRYDITFSRIAFDGVTVPLFIMLALYLVDCGLEHKGVVPFLSAGFFLGIALAFYQPMLIFVLLLAAAVAVMALKALRPSEPGVSFGERWAQHIRPWLPHCFLALFGFFIAAGPLAEYALFVPSKLFSRLGTASIATETDEPLALGSLWTNTWKHLGMYHAEGDTNGRHNLPGAPLLDPFTGVLFALGAAVAFRGWREPPFRGALVLGAAMLAAGVFSRPSTAPHALRTIGIIPVILLFVLVALAALARAVRSRVPAAPRALMSAVWACLLLAVAGSNLDTYFNRQMRDTDVRFAHSMAEAWVSTEMRRMESTHDFLVSVHFWNHPTYQFLAPRLPNARRLWVTEPVPLPVNAERALLLFLDPTMDDLLDRLRAVYPGCTVVNVTPSEEAHTVARAVYLSVEMLRSPRAP